MKRGGLDVGAMRMEAIGLKSVVVQLGAREIWAREGGKRYE
jgi:hypothetical protein